MYKKNDEVVFQINDTAFTYKVINPEPNQWFLSAVGNSNDVVFKKLHIHDKHDKETFVVYASGCMLAHHEGMFPVIRCDDESGINKVINALQQKCTEMSSKPDISSKLIITQQYKKGDVVKIISKYAIQDRNRYRFYFNSEMDQYCNHTYIVDDVRIPPTGVLCTHLIPDDGMVYKLKDGNGKILPYDFSSSMFESKLVLPQVADAPIWRPDTFVDTETKINTNMYKDGDRVTFQIDNEHLIYTVSRDNGCWWLSNRNGYNSEIFHKLHISDRFEFVHKISQHMSTKKDASFPEVWCNDETEINKVIDALLKACDEYNRHNRREIPYVPEQCATLEYKIKLGKPKNKYQLKFTN